MKPYVAPAARDEPLLADVFVWGVGVGVEQTAALVGELERKQRQAVQVRFGKLRKQLKRRKG